jgi:hypothetical protein
MYRAYSNDEVVEIVPFNDSLVGYAARKVKVDWYPKACPEENRPEGMRFLIGLPPVLDVVPQPFVKGTYISHAHAHTVYYI